MSTSTYHYAVPADAHYDYFGESVRDDLETIVDCGNTACSVDFKMTFECGDMMQLPFDVPRGTPYDYIGDTLRYYVEDRFIRNNSDMNVVAVYSINKRART